MRKLLLPLFGCLMTLSLAAQTSLKGTIIDQATGQPVVGATVTLANQSISTTTNQKGEFQLLYLEAMDEEVVIDATGFISTVELVDIHADQENVMDPIALQVDMSKEAHDEVVLNLADEELSDDEGKSQSQGAQTSASTDVFNHTTAWAWSTARYRNRGYEGLFQTVYINGVNFNSAERGMFNFSAMGGLNEASRFREEVNPMAATNFTFGGIGRSTNYLMNASQYAQGWRISAAGTNRNYKVALRGTYASGPLKNGWSFVGQVAFRFSPYIDQKGIIGEGIQYYSFGYFFGAEKIFNNGSRLNLVTFGAPTLRGQSGAVTQEIYDLTGTNNYNPYWGYQNGHMRNSREVNAFDPTAIANYDWKIDENNILKFALGYHFSFYSNSSLNWFNAPDPRPDYYRNLPSAMWDQQIVNPWSQYNTKTDMNGQLYNPQLYDQQNATILNDQLIITHFPYGLFAGANLNGLNLGEGFVGNDGYQVGPTIYQDAYNNLVDRWRTRDNNTTQINWDNIYAANYAWNAMEPDAPARYIMERRWNNIQEASANILYEYSKIDHLKMTAGLEGKYSEGIHYKTLDDLLGGRQWIDIDPFADRDIKELASNVEQSQSEITYVRQNNLLNPNKVIKKGDTFGYNYRMHLGNLKFWYQNEWSFNDVDFYYALQGTFSSMLRTTKMLNGRAVYQSTRSVEARRLYLGPDYMHVFEWEDGTTIKGNSHYFFDPAFKLGVNYKINGRNHLKLNAMAMTKAPNARDAYISQRVHDRAIDEIYVHDDAKNLKNFYAASERIVSGDLTYEFNYPLVRGRITGYYTQFWNGTELNGYYDDEAHTFVNQAVSGINRRHFGLEAAATVKLGTYFSLTGAVAVGDYRYTSNAFSVTSAENGMSLGEDKDGDNIYETRDTVLLKGLRVSTGPQVNTSLKLNFFHPKMWFAGITVSYYDWNFLDFAPSRRMKGLFTGQRADGSPVNGWFGDIYANAIETVDGQPLNIMERTEAGYPVNAKLDANGVPVLKYPYNMMVEQESLVAQNVWNRIIIDLNVGKMFYLKNRQSISLNLSVTNITNNTHFKTGGYQQARLPRASVQHTMINKRNIAQSVITANPWKFPSKYYYAWGANFYFTITYKF